MDREWVELHHYVIGGANGLMKGYLKVTFVNLLAARLTALIALTSSFVLRYKCNLGLMNGRWVAYEGPFLKRATW